MLQRRETRVDSLADLLFWHLEFVCLTFCLSHWLCVCLTDCLAVWLCLSSVSVWLSVSLSNCLPVSYWLSDWVSEILLTFWTTLFWWLSREVNIYIFLHSITWGRPGCLLWHNNRNILTNWLVVASDMTQALQNNFLLKYYTVPTRTIVHLK